jgi:hypothetical protein
MGEKIEITPEMEEYIEKMKGMSKQEQDIEVRKNIIEDVKASINVPSDWRVMLQTPRLVHGGIHYIITPKDKTVTIKVSNMYGSYFLVYFKYRESFIKECNDAIAKAGGW